MGDPHIPKVCVRYLSCGRRCVQDGEEDLPNCISLRVHGQRNAGTASSVAVSVYWYVSQDLRILADTTAHE